MANSKLENVKPDPLNMAMIYARSENHCIGVNGSLPWRLPDEFKHFKSTTMGHPIIMGRRTFEDHENILPGRLNVVISRQLNYEVASPAEIYHDLDTALERSWQDNSLVFVIGGVSLFQMGYAHPAIQYVYETVVHAHVEGDTFLPEFDFSNWHTKVLDQHTQDEKHTHAFTIYRHERNN